MFQYICLIKGISLQNLKESIVKVTEVDVKFLMKLVQLIILFF